MHSHPPVHSDSALYHLLLSLFFFNATAPTEIYTLSLHDALPIYLALANGAAFHAVTAGAVWLEVDGEPARRDRKSTRLNSSHQIISYAVFCLKKKKTNKTDGRHRSSERGPRGVSCRPWSRLALDS